MNRHEKHLRDLCLIASDIVPVAAATIASAIVLNNRVISYGINKNKTHPFQKRFGKNDRAICTHSEVDAIYQALKRISLKEISHSTLYVARVKKNEAFAKRDSWGNAKPCVGCQRAIVTFGIKRVYYSTDVNGVYECL